MNSPTPECLTCGYPALRPTGHATWCAAVSLLNTQEPVITRDAIAAYLHNRIHHVRAARR